MQFCQAAAHEFRLGINACAVLTPTERAGKQLAEQLNYLGLEAHFMSSRELDLNRQGVKVLTLKSAKGLEFPIAVIAGFLDAPYRGAGRTSQFTSSEENQWDGGCFIVNSVSGIATTLRRGIFR